MILRKTKQELIDNPLTETQVTELKKSIKLNNDLGNYLEFYLDLIIFIVFIFVLTIIKFESENSFLMNIYIKFMFASISSFMVFIVGLLIIEKIKLKKYPVDLIVDKSAINIFNDTAFKKFEIDENSLNDYGKEMYKNIKKQGRNPYGFELDIIKIKLGKIKYREE